MSATFIITDNKSTIKLTKPKARELELKFNVTSKGHTWSKIGDALFNFWPDVYTDDFVVTTDDFVVTTEQLEFLNKIIPLSKEQCKYV